MDRQTNIDGWMDGWIDGQGTSPPVASLKSFTEPPGIVG